MNNLKGFSLIEVLVSVGILSIVGMVLLNLSAAQIQMEKAIQAKEDVDNTVAVAKIYMRQSATCLSNVTSGNIQGLGNLTDSNIAKDSVVSKIQDSAGNNIVTLGVMPSNNQVTISSITLTNKTVVTSNSVYLANLSFVFSIKNVPIKARTFPVTLVTNGAGTVTACSAMDDTSESSGSSGTAASSGAPSGTCPQGAQPTTYTACAANGTPYTYNKTVTFSSAGFPTQVVQGGYICSNGHWANTYIPSCASGTGAGSSE